MTIRAGKAETSNILKNDYVNLEVRKTSREQKTRVVIRQEGEEGKKK